MTFAETSLCQKSICDVLQLVQKPVLLYRMTPATAIKWRWNARSCWASSAGGQPSHWIWELQGAFVFFFSFFLCQLVNCSVWFASPFLKTAAIYIKIIMIYSFNDIFISFIHCWMLLEPYPRMSNIILIEMRTKQGVLDICYSMSCQPEIMKKCTMYVFFKLLM